VGHCRLQALLTISSRLDSAPRYPLSFPFGAHPHGWRRGRCAVVMRAAADRLAPDAENELEKFGWCSTRGFIRRELIYNQIFNVMPLRCRHCRSDDFKIRFCESTPRQPEIRIRSEGGQKKAKFVARTGDPNPFGGGKKKQSLWRDAASAVCRHRWRPVYSMTGHHPWRPVPFLYSLNNRVVTLSALLPLC